MSNAAPGGRSGWDDRRHADPVREGLVDAAAEVFARDGYDGARIQDIVRAAGVTTGAVYGRFRGKGELLHEAVVTRAVPQGPMSAGRFDRVADLVGESAKRVDGGLGTRDALLLETYVAARREPEVASAVADANQRWLDAAAPLVEAALADGTIAEDIDPDAVLYLVRVLRLGSLLHRGAGLPAPDPESWATLIERVVASFGRSDLVAADAPDTDPPAAHDHQPGGPTT